MDVLRELFKDLKDSLLATFKTGMPSILRFYNRAKKIRASNWKAKKLQDVSKQMQGIWTLQGSSGLNIHEYTILVEVTVKRLML